MDGLPLINQNNMLMRPNINDTEILFGGTDTAPAQSVNHIAFHSIVPDIDCVSRRRAHILRFAQYSFAHQMVNT